MEANISVVVFILEAPVRVDEGFAAFPWLNKLVILGVKLAGNAAINY